MFDTSKAATRGNPSFVWRDGQVRRFKMLQAAAPLAGRRALEFGCGLGTYAREMQKHSPHVFGFDIEIDRVQQGAQNGITGLLGSVGERLPFADKTFDIVFSNDVLEHVQDDRECAREITRVLRPGGRAVIFVPNRLYFFETHGVYWRGQYYFGNKPFVNWLPDTLRNKLAPHVRAYTGSGLKSLFAGLPMHMIELRQIYGGFDNIVRRYGKLGQVIRGAWQGLESTPLSVFGLEHLIVLEKTK